MNTANYLSTTDYPVTTQGLDFIQNNILCLEQMAAAFGDGNWILSGMTENEEGNLTPGVVALVENSKATVVNFTQGGVSASGLKSKRFRIDSVTNALPQRTYQFLVPDEDGEITNLDRIDIHELAEQIKDNSAAIAKNARDIANQKFYLKKITENNFFGIEFSRIVSCCIVISFTSDIVVYNNMDVQYHPHGAAPTVTLTGYSIKTGNPDTFSFDLPSIPTGNLEVSSVNVIYMSDYE